MTVPFDDLSRILHEQDGALAYPAAGPAQTWGCHSNDSPPVPAFLAPPSHDADDYIHTHGELVAQL